MIRFIRWHEDGTLESTAIVTVPQDRPVLTAPGGCLWVDCVDPTPEEDLWLQQALPLHALTIEDLTRPRRESFQSSHLPKIEEFPDYLLAIVNPLPRWMTPPTKGMPEPPVSPTQESSERPRRHWDRPQLSILLQRKILITHHYELLPCLETAWNYVLRHPDCGRRGPDYLCHWILDAMVDEYAPVVEMMAEKLDRLETMIYRQPSHRVLTRLIHLKREVSFLRKTLILEHNLLSRLVQGEFELVSDTEMAYYRNVRDHLVRYMDLIESAREMVSDLMQSYMSMVSNKLNEIMKVLAMISTTILPMTLIAGIYGMNFDSMPELRQAWGYPMALGLMAMSGGLAFGFFRWKQWL